MFADPITLTVNGVAKVLNRIEQAGTSARYSNADGTFTLNITHNVTKSDRVRSVVAFRQQKVVSDPITSTASDFDDTTVSLTIDRPFYGFSDTEIQYLESALEGFLDATALTKIYGRES